MGREQEGKSRKEMPLLYILEKRVQKEEKWKPKRKGVEKTRGRGREKETEGEGRQDGEGLCVEVSGTARTVA